LVQEVNDGHVVVDVQVIEEGLSNLKILIKRIEMTLSMGMVSRILQL
jgi:hypothetical protein